MCITVCMMYLLLWLIISLLHCRCPGCDGEGNEAWPDWCQWPAAGMCTHQLYGGTGLPEGHGISRQLCLGQPLLHDLSGQTGLCSVQRVLALTFLTLLLLDWLALGKPLIQNILGKGWFFTQADTSQWYNPLWTMILVFIATTWMDEGLTWVAALYCLWHADCKHSVPQRSEVLTVSLSPSGGQKERNVPMCTLTPTESHPSTMTSMYARVTEHENQSRHKCPKHPWTLQIWVYWLKCPSRQKLTLLKL